MARLEIIADTFLSAGTPAQQALPRWFSLQSKIQGEIIERISTNRKALEKKLGGRNKPRLLHAEGGWAAVLKMPPGRSDEAWALLLLEKDHVACHPGYLFDFTEGPFLVTSLLPPGNIFEEAWDRITARVDSEIVPIKTF